MLANETAHSQLMFSIRSKTVEQKLATSVVQFCLQYVVSLVVVLEAKAQKNWSRLCQQSLCHRKLIRI